MTVQFGPDVIYAERRWQECEVAVDKLHRAAEKARALRDEIEMMAAKSVCCDAHAPLNDFASMLDDLIGNALDHPAGLLQEEGEECAGKLRYDR